jgi:hypothetical protein
MTDKNNNPITSIGEAIDLLIPIISSKINGLDNEEVTPKSISAIMTKIFDDKEFMDSMSKIVDGIKLDTQIFERNMISEPDKQIEREDETRKSEEENDVDITSVTI